MFGKLFAKKNKQETFVQASNTQEDVLLSLIKKKRKEDPLIGARIGGKEITQRLIKILKNEHGVHVETLLACIGSLGGYACHMAVREIIVNTGKAKENEAFIIVGGNDGNNYYFGDLVNKPLVEDVVSFWSLAGGTAQHFGKDCLPDLQSIFKHVSSSIGGEQFGIPQVPEKNMPSILPIDLVKKLWPVILPIVDKYCESPAERPLLFGVSAQEVIEMGKDTIPPGIAIKLLMECAVPMSKIGPEWIED